MTTMHPRPYGNQVPDGSTTGRVIVDERTHADDGLSLQRQEAAVRDYLAKHPQWNIAAVYRDSGSSAFDRPGLRHMLAAARAGQFDAVVVHPVDRLARRIDDLDTIVRTLHDASVTPHNATEPLDTSTP